MFTKSNFGVSFRVEIVVCGTETITAIVTDYNHFIPAVILVPNIFTLTANAVDAWFLLTFPGIGTGVFNYDWLPEPNGFLNCIVYLTGLYQTCDHNGPPFTHSNINYDTTAVPSANGFYPLTIDRATPFGL